MNNKKLYLYIYGVIPLEVLVSEMLEDENWYSKNFFLVYHRSWGHCLDIIIKMDGFCCELRNSRVNIFKIYLLMHHFAMFHLKIHIFSMN